MHLLYAKRHDDDVNSMIEFIKFNKFISDESLASCGSIIKSTLLASANGGGGHKARVRVVLVLYDVGFDLNQAYKIVQDCKKWKDPVDNTLFYMEGLYKYWCKKNNKSDYDFTTKYTQPKKNIPSTPNIIIVPKINWVKGPSMKNASVKHLVAMIWTYFINNHRSFGVMESPKLYNGNSGSVKTKWGYRRTERQITDDDIIKHLETGINPNTPTPYTIGVYDRDQTSHSKWLCFDIDDKDDDRHGRNLNEIMRIYRYFIKEHGVRGLIEKATEGTESYHLWFFCEPAPYKDLNSVGTKALKDLKIDCEMKPSAGESEVGGLMRLPLGYNRKRGARSVIL